MKFAERHYCFRWELKSPREKLWPHVADTNRFNRDTGLRPMITDEVDSTDPTVRLMHLNRWGLCIRWREYPFDWVAPEKFGVVRRYDNGPLESLRMQATLEPTPENGTVLHYNLWIVPRNFIGWLLSPLQIGIFAKNQFGKAFRGYDELAAIDSTEIEQPLVSQRDHVAGSRRRIEAIAQRLSEYPGLESAMVRPIIDLLKFGDDFSLSRMRPYALAKLWNIPRKNILELFLQATREGLLDFSWEILCPLCRGAKSTVASLRDLNGAAHCESCNIEFDANLDQAVELVFTPNPAIRIIETHEFCVGGPQVTPHIVAQQTLQPAANLQWHLSLKPGRYRLRTVQGKSSCYLIAKIDDAPTRSIPITNEGFDPADTTIDSDSQLTISNGSDSPQLVLLEKLAWMDDAVTAAEVTSRQTFRDLFSSEVIGYGERISVGKITIAFTDLKGSTSLYEKIGDAPAFGVVMEHFEILKKHVARNDGAIVKTMGDAIMAVFTQPTNALKALLAAQKELTQSKNSQPLVLKAGIHTGHCIAINQDARLDYFGTAVNLAARLECLSCGQDLVVSKAFLDEPTVISFLEKNANNLKTTAENALIKGLDSGPVAIVKIRQSDVDR